MGWRLNKARTLVVKFETASETRWASKERIHG